MGIAGEGLPDRKSPSPRSRSKPQPTPGPTLPARRPQVSIAFLLVITTVAAVSAACGAYLVRVAYGDWKEMIWFGPVTSAAPLVLMSAMAFGLWVCRRFLG